MTGAIRSDERPAATSAVEHPAAALGRPLRSACAATLLLGTGLQAASFPLLTAADLDGHYEQVAASPGLADVSLVLNVLAMPFLVGGAAVYVYLGQRRSPRLAWTGGLLLASGLVLLATMMGREVITYALAQDGVLPPAEVADLLRTVDTVPAMVVQIVFLLGVALGLLLTAVALWRSRAVPRPAIVGLVAFLVVDIAGRPVEAHLLAFLSAGWIAVSVLQAPTTRRAV
jgi:multisubunit Na+/H+ antiporter MnhB subunit